MNESEYTCPGHLKNRNDFFFPLQTQRITLKKLKQQKESEKKKKKGKPIIRYELKPVCFYVFETPTNTEQ